MKAADSAFLVSFLQYMECPSSKVAGETVHGRNTASAQQSISKLSVLTS